MQMPMMKNSLAYFMFSLSANLLMGCTQPTVEEISRISNPTKEVDAVIVMKMTNATVATPTEVYLTSFGEVIKGDPIFRADNLEDIQIHWQSYFVLEIEAKKARVFINIRDYSLERSNKKNQKIDITYNIKK